MLYVKYVYETIIKSYNSWRFRKGRDIHTIRFEKSLFWRKQSAIKMIRFFRRNKKKIIWSTSKFRWVMNIERFLHMKKFWTLHVYVWHFIARSNTFLVGYLFFSWSHIHNYFRLIYRPRTFEEVKNEKEIKVKKKPSIFSSIPEITNTNIKNIKYLNQNLKIFFIFSKNYLFNFKINFKPTNLLFFNNLKNFSKTNINFVRKNKVFNKSRYSRNRQYYRTGVYWCLYINIIAVLGFYFWFYKLTFNFGYFWWLLWIFFCSFFFTKFIKFFSLNFLKEIFIDLKLFIFFVLNFFFYFFLKLFKLKYLKFFFFNFYFVAFLS